MNFFHFKQNKVIRPKSRASALSKMSGRQSDKHFFSKTLLKRLFTPPSFFSLFRDIKIESLYNNFVTDGLTNRLTDRQTDLQTDQPTNKYLLMP